MVMKLIKYTTIPDSLYVNRNADNQLRNIIEEMQRPGYVLVARQMGKTNLLFNAKRKLENSNRLFVYIDLSNVFRKERECYRYLIDCIIEPNEDLFNEIKSELKRLREDKLPPHNEYFRSLRLILDFFKGDIVIILDEIDALRSVDYSDNIFAQIRSNYFSRTSYKVFERLTYILSGVIEPTELIKDKNKSPFNIGEKIYLDDFSLQEYNEFICKSGLKLTDELSLEIYNWTRGNPRLTFDICSSVERLIIDGVVINQGTIENIVKKEYLTSYDIAPIDHIRELVKSDKKVRNAILNIYTKKFDKLSDEIKKKLYLYGIIDSKFDGDTKIKNPIIELSLTEEWIKSIEKQTKDNYSYGLEKIDQCEFVEAIDLLNEFLSNSSPNTNQSEVCNYNIGFAYYKLRKFENAINYFSKEYVIPVYKANVKSFLGICKISMGNVKDGISILEDIVQHKTHDFAYRNALLNLALLIAKDDKQRALILYDDLFISAQNNLDESSEEELNKLKTLACYYKSEILFEKNEKAKACETLNEALKYSSLSDSLYLKFLISSISDESKVDVITDIVNTIVDSELQFDEKYSDLISFNENHVFSYLITTFELDLLDDFEKLLEYCYEKLYAKKINKYQLLFNISRKSLKQKEILKYILNKVCATEQVALDALRTLCFELRNHSDFLIYFNDYKAIFLSNEDIINDDIYLFAIAIKHYSDDKKISEALELCLLLEEKLKYIDDDDLLFESLIIYYWLSNLYFSLKNKIKAIEYAEKTISIINNSERERSSMIDEKGLKVIIEQMNQIKTSFLIRKPIVNTVKYGRNDRIKVQYLGGNTQEGKYKKFEADILAERCRILI